MDAFRAGVFIGVLMFGSLLVWSDVLRPLLGGALVTPAGG